MPVYEQEPFRLRVLKAITASLEEITLANGFQHDLTGCVFRGRLVYDDNDPVPMLTILEPPLPTDPSRGPITSGSETAQWDLLIQGFIRDDKVNPTDVAHYLMADVKRRLAQEEKRVLGRTFDAFGLGNGSREGQGNCIMAMTVGQGVVRPPDERSDLAYFWLTLTLDIVEDMTNPFV